MLTRRQFLSQSILLAGSLGVAACTPAAAPAPAATTAPAKPAESKPAETKPAAAAPAAASTTQYKLDLGGYKGPAPTGQNIKLRFMRQSFNPVTEAAIKSWNAEWAAAYPNITIEEEPVPYGDLNQKLQTYVAAGDAPDAMMGKGDFIQAYVFNGIVLNLSEFLTDAYINDIPQAMRDQQSVNGKLYGMPWEQGQVMLYFNKDLFEKAGVATPPETDDLTKGWTWDQLADAWTKLNASINPGGDGPTYTLASSAYGNGGPGSSYWYEGIYSRSMGDPKAAKDSSAYKTFAGVSPDGLTATGYVNTPEAVKGMTLYQKIFKDKYSPSVPTPNQFEDGKAATRFSSINLANRFSNPDSAPKFKWGVTPVPRGNILFNHISGDSPIIYAKTKYPAETAAYMGFVHNDKNRMAFHSNWGSMPARTSLFDKMAGYKEFPRSLAVATTKVGYAPPATPGYLEYFSVMNTANKDIALGAAVEARLNKAAKEIDDLLVQYKK